MNVEDSYEGAVRRLRRLGHAGVNLAPPQSLSRESHSDDRMRDLEELATLACDENEQLTRELDSARREIDRLRRLVGTLQETIAGEQSDESLGMPKTGGRGAAFYFCVLVLVGGIGAGLFVLRPWEQLRGGYAAAAATAPAVQTPAPTPVVAAPPPVAPKVEATVPKVEPVIPKAEPVVPKVAPTIPKVEPAAAAPAPVKSHSHRQHASKHHASKSSHHHEGRSAARSSTAEPAGTNDPLGGLNL